MSRSVRALIGVLIVVTIGQAVSLVNRGNRQGSDIGVFYRECLLLDAGMGGDLYTRRDAVRGWPISLAPAGLALLQPLAALGPLGAGVGWAAVNLGLVVLSLAALRRFLRHATTAPLEGVFPWAIAVFLVLSWGSIQVGQFSVLFVACWILFLTAWAERRYTWAALLLAIPSAIKIYPILLLAIPLSLAADIRTSVRQMVVLMAGLAIMCLAIPAMFYGARVWDLNLSFWQHVILSRAQVSFMQTLGGTNQSLDTVLLRYLSNDAQFHGLHPFVPHLRLARNTVLDYASLTRLLIVLVSTATVWRWRRKQKETTAHDAMLVAAVWSSTLYLMLPETKARYAIYTFLGFVPWIEAAVAQYANATLWDRLKMEGGIVAGLILVTAFAADPLEGAGIGVIGAIGLWVANIRLMARADSPAAVPCAS